MDMSRHTRNLSLASRAILLSGPTDNKFSTSYHQKLSFLKYLNLLLCKFLPAETQFMGYVQEARENHVKKKVEEGPVALGTIWSRLATFGCRNPSYCHCCIEGQQCFYGYSGLGS
nr:hypothetical protein Iba_chr02aCG13070 [Ipomoea batatas]